MPPLIGIGLTIYEGNSSAATPVASGEEQQFQSATTPSTMVSGVRGISTPAQVLTDDIASADVAFTFGTGEDCDGLDITNLTRKIPTGSTIDGIEILTKKWGQLGNTQDTIIQLTAGGALIGTGKEDTGTNWPAVPFPPTLITYGGPADKWGATLTDIILNANDFGVVVQCHNTSQPNIANWVYVGIKVYYS